MGNSQGFSKESLYPVLDQRPVGRAEQTVEGRSKVRFSLPTGNFSLVCKKINCLIL